jgi:hypothetical protein
MITRVVIQETQKLTPTREVYNLGNAVKGKLVFWTYMPYLGSYSQRTASISHSFLVQEPDLLSSLDVGLL